MRLTKILAFAGFLIFSSLWAFSADAASYTVDDLGDTVDDNIGNGVCHTAGNVCTLRAAIAEANAAAGADTITFSVTGTIDPASAYNIDTNGSVTIDGGADHDVLIDGTGTAGIDGFNLGTAGNVIKGLVIKNFRYAIVINGASATGNKIQNNYLGTDETGNAISSSGNVRSISVQSGASNIIGTDGDGNDDSTEGNVITAGSANGSAIHLATNSNVVAGNKIGVGADGTTDLGIGAYGMFLTDANSNIIGFDGTGTAADERNVIAGFNEDNTSYGIFLNSSDSNRIAGNYLCTTTSGDTVLACSIGIQLASASLSNIIGTNGDGTGDADEGNVLTAGTATLEVVMIAGGSNGTIVAGNKIGVGADGTTDISAVNGAVGVRISASANCIVGFDGTGTVANERNIIAGLGESTGLAVNIISAGATNNRIAGNYIGVLANGTTPLPNYLGVYIVSSADGSNTIGTNGDGTGDADEGNVINPIAGGTGVQIDDASNTVAGNKIGIGADGTTDLGTGTYGVYVNGGNSNIIGFDGTGTVANERNIISCFDEDNTSYGVYLNIADSNRVAGNYIGTKADGTTACGNYHSVYMQTGADTNIIGTNGDGTGDADEGNVLVTVAGAYGMRIQSGTGNIVAGNKIGVGADGTTDLGAGAYGIYVVTNSNVIGFDGTGTAADERNIISGFNEDATSFGIQITSAASNVVAGNYIGTQSNGTTALANSVGVYVTGAGSTSNIIGTNGDGTGDASEGNVLSGNGLYGVSLESLSSGTMIAGNKIGTGSDGTTDLGNGTHGVYVNDVASNTIGGDIADEENLIRFNGDAASEYGIYITGASATSNVIQRNKVYDNQTNILVNANATTAPAISQIASDVVGITSTAGYTLQVFKDTDGDSVCEAMTYLGAATDNGDGTFSYTASGLAAGDKVVTTAKTGTSNTSNLSTCLDIVSIAFAATASNAAESTTSVNLSVTTSATVGADTTVAYSVTGGTATGSGTDYTLASGTATVSNGTASTNINITVNNDTMDEPNETIVVTLSSPSKAVLGTNTGHTYTINDDDSAPSITIADNSFTETDAAGTSQFTVTLSAASGYSVTVDYGTSAGSATGGGTDYTNASGTLTFISGQTSKTVDVTVTGDTLDEDDEAFNLDLTNGGNATIADAQGVMTIQDNDAAPTVTLGVADSPLAENGGVATYTATLSTASGKTVTTNLAFSGTATLTNDYARSGTSITINAGATTGTATVTGADDSVDEDAETVIVDISSVINGTESGSQQATATITDDDASPTVTLSLVGSPLAENGGVATFTATSSDISERTVTVNLSFSGTATNNTDYTASSASITINAGSTTGTATVTGTNDSIDEANETVITDISSVTNGTETGTQQETATITDDDAAGVTVAHSGGSTQVTEGGATDAYTFVLTSEPTADVTITLNAGTQVSPSAPTVVFTNANWNQAQTITVTAVNDNVVEGLHTTDITHTSASGDSFYNGFSVSLLSVSITDNDTAGVSITETAGATNIVEGSTTDTYTLVLTSEPTFDVTITLNPGSQASLNYPTFTFTAANWNISQTVTVTAVVDEVEEGDHTQVISHAVTSADSDYSGIAVVSVTAMITEIELEVVADAGFDITITSGSSVTLDGSGSTGSDLTFSWSIVSGGGSLSAETTSAPVYTAPTETETVEIQLTVISGDRSDTDSLTVHVLLGTEVAQEDLQVPMVGYASSAIYELQDSSGTVLRTAQATIRAPNDDYTFTLTSTNYLVVSSPSLAGTGKVFLSHVPLSQISGTVDVVSESLSARALVRQSIGGVSLAISASENFTEISGTQEGDRFGEFLTAGDIDCDGADEILVGAPGFGYYGGLFIFNGDGVAISVILGSETRPISSVTTADFLDNCSADLVFGPNNPALNAPLRRQDTVVAGDGVSQASLLLGQSNFDNAIDLTQDPVDYSVGDGVSGDIISQAMGDLNGDGEVDLVLVSADGEALIYFGGVAYDPVVPSDEADVVISGESGSTGFGNMISIGDVTGDGANDLVIGAPEYGSEQSGAVYVIFGSKHWDAAIDLAASANVIRLTGTAAGDRIGSDLLLADSNSDGKAEIYTAKDNGTVTFFTLQAEAQEAGEAGGYGLGGSGWLCSLNPSSEGNPSFPWILLAVWMTALIGLRFRHRLLT